MKNKIISTLLVLTMALSIVSAMGISAMATDTAITDAMIIYNSGNYYLDADIEGSVNVAAGYEVTIDLKGHTIKNTSDFAIANYGKLTITDSSLSGTPAVRYFTDSNNDGAFETFVTEKPNSMTGVITVSGGVVIGGVKNGKNAELTVEAGNYVGGANGINNQCGTVTLKKGTIQGNNDSGINNADGTVTIGAEGGNDGDVVIANNSGAYGGGIINGLWHNDAKAIVTMYCGTIENNTAEAGGGIANYVSDCTGTATVEIKGGKIINNTATSIGGGIFNSGNSATAKVVISGNTEISGNSAVSADMSGGEGGGIYNTAVLELKGGSIKNNTAISTGAVVNTKTGVFTMTDGTISGNKALQENVSTENLGNVGGIYNDGKMEMSGGSITGNTAKHCGGVFSKGTITLKKTAVIKDNTEQDNAPANLFVGAGKLELGTAGDALTAGADVHYTVCKIGSHSVISMTDKIDASPVAEGVPTEYLTPDVVCRIGDATDNVAYATLQKAVRNVKSGSTITLLKDNAENVTVSSGKKFTIDENGKSFNPEKVTGEFGIKLTREDNKNLHVYNSVDYGASVKNFFNKLNEIGLSELIGAHVKLIGVKLLAIVEIIKNSGNLFAEIFR